MPAELAHLGACEAAAEDVGQAQVAVITGPIADLAARLDPSVEIEQSLCAWWEEAQTQRATLEAADPALVVIARDRLARDPETALRPVLALWGESLPDESLPDETPEEAPTAFAARPPAQPEALAALILAEDPACFDLARWLAARCDLPEPVSGLEAAKALLQDWQALAGTAERTRMEAAVAQAQYQAEGKGHARTRQSQKAREAVLGQRALEDAEKVARAEAELEGWLARLCDTPLWRWGALRRQVRERARKDRT